MAPSGQSAPDYGNLVGVNKETVTDVTSTNFPGHYPAENLEWDVDYFSDHFSIQFHYNEQFNASFSLIGVDASVANAFRRIMISEIPTLAIENVYVENNTSVIQDEVLAHRLGLVPFKGSKEGIRKFLKWWKKPEGGEIGDYGECFDFNTIKLELRLECTRNPDAGPDEKDPTKLYNHAHVYARDIAYIPEGRQARYFSGDDTIAPVNPDILIAKLRPGQAIDLEMHMHKGVGSDHAKFSPVCTASYRLMPTITITRPILGADAEKFARCFPRGVIGLEKATKKDAAAAGEPYKEGMNKAVVVDPMRDTVSRECLRHEEFEGKVKLGRRRDHFIYSIESAGQWDSDELFLESVKLLKAKCHKLEQQVMGMIR